jgi:hypothetical protein
MKSQLVFLFSVKRHIKFQQSARSVVDVVEPRELKLVTSRSSDKGDVVGYLSKFSSTDYIYMSNILYLTHVSILRLGSYCFWVWSPHAMQQVWPELCICTCIYILTNWHPNKSMTKKADHQNIRFTIKQSWQQQILCDAEHPKCPRPAGQIHQQKSWGLLVPPWTWAVRVHAYICSLKRRFNIACISWFRIHAKAFASRRISCKAHRAKRIGLKLAPL